MSGFGVVWRREVAARHLLLWASLAIGAFVALLPWIPAGGPTPPADLRGAGAVGALLLWGTTLAAGLGATAVGGALETRRLAFDFRLPAGEVAIWLGRLTAGLFVTLTSVAIVVAVPLLFGADLAGGSGALDTLVESLFSGEQGHDGLLALAPLALTALFLLAHVAAVAFAGARSWLALDVAAVLLAKAAVWLGWRQLGYWIADAARLRLLAGALALAAVGWIVASVAAARLGRSEPDRAHRAIAAATALAMLAVAVGALAYARWYISPTVADLRAGISRERPLADGSEWSVVSGLAPARDDVPFTFLSHAASGRSLRLGPLPSHPLFAPAVALSADRSTLVWPERSAPYSDASRLVTLDARDPRAEPAPSALAWPMLPLAWGAAPDGRSVASLHRGAGGGVRLEHEELATGRLVDLVPLPMCAWDDGGVTFVDATRIEVACSPPGRALSDPLRRLAVDLPTREVVDLGPAPGADALSPE